MLCLKCKNEIADNLLRCPHCGIKVNMYCPECHTLNRFGTKYCTECGTELLKVCLKCGSNNLYYAKECRKCKTPFSTAENEAIVEQPQTTLNKISEDKQDDFLQPVVEENKQETILSLKDLLEKQNENDEPKVNYDLKNCIIEEQKVDNSQDSSEIVFINKNEDTKVNDDKENLLIKEQGFDNFADSSEIVFIDKDEDTKVNNDKENLLIKEQGFDNFPDSSEIVFIDKDEETENQPNSAEPNPVDFLELNEEEEHKEKIKTEHINIQNNATKEISLIKSPETNTLNNMPLPAPHSQNRVIQSCIMKKSTDKKATKEFGGFFGFGKKKKDKQPSSEIQDINSESSVDKTEEKKNLSFKKNKIDESIIEKIDILTEQEETAPEIKVKTDRNDSVSAQEETPSLSEDIQTVEVFQTTEDIQPKEEKAEPDFEEQEHEETTQNTAGFQEEFLESECTVINAAEKITNLLNTNPKKCLAGINGEQGCGKSTIVRQILFNLSGAGFIPFYGRCNETTQISCPGFFQDAFLSLFGLPGFTPSNINNFVKSNKHALSETFSLLDDKDLTDFVNILYPNQTDTFENILINKKHTFEIIKKAVKSLLEHSPKVVFAIDNFDYIDSMSYELICQLIDENYFGENAKLIISYNSDKMIQSYFTSENLPDVNFATFRVTPLNNEESKTFISQFLNNRTDILPNDVLKNLQDYSKGNILTLEQNIALLYDRNLIYNENDEIKFAINSSNAIIPESIDSVIRARIDSLIPPLRNALYVASLLGERFDKQLFELSLSYTKDKAEQILIQFKNMLFLEDLNTYSMTFKSFTMWKIIQNLAKQSEQYRELSVGIERNYKKYILSSPLQRIIIASDILEVNDLFKLWTNAEELVAKIGDSNIYVTIQKQKLKLLNDNEISDTPELYNTICEQIGKLTYKSNPKDAIAYLSNPIAKAKENNDTLKSIDLCSYLVNSCYAVGNYYGVIEAVDLVVSQSCNNISGLEIALLKQRKLKALYNLGNCEEIVMLMSNEICPILQSAILQGIPDVAYKNLTYTAWLESNIVLAAAYSLQGNSQSFMVIKDIREFLPNITLNATYFATKTDLVEALAYTSDGNINASDEILSRIANEYMDINLEVDLLSQWNLINVINKILCGKTDEIRNDLFELATFANNANEHFVKNIIKLVLGYVFQTDGNYSKALEIYNEQVTYFAKEKNAIGALLSWYLIAQVTLITDDAEKASDIAKKALEVADGPKINLTNFSVYLKKFIAEIFVIKGDLDSAKMYLEQAIKQADEFGLQYPMFKLTIAYASYLEETLRAGSTTEIKLLVSDIFNTYNHAYSIAKKLDLQNLTDEVIQAKSVFKTYCKLNNYIINDND